MTYDITQATIELQRIKRRLNNIRRDFSGQDIHCADLEMDFGKHSHIGDRTNVFASVHKTLMLVEKLEHYLLTESCKSTQSKNI